MTELDGKQTWNIRHQIPFDEMDKAEIQIFRNDENRSFDIDATVYGYREDLILALWKIKYTLELMMRQCGKTTNNNS